eukprot:6482765-Amphidinium_carterae.1
MEQILTDAFAREKGVRLRGKQRVGSQKGQSKRDVDDEEEEEEAGSRGDDHTDDGDDEEQMSSFGDGGG